MCRRALNKRHGARAAHTCAAQQLQQQGFGLVVGMVRQRYEIACLPGKCRMAQLARCRLDAVFAQRCNINVFDMQRNGVLRAKSGAEIRPRIGIGTDAMMNMQCGESPEKTRRKPAQQVQQHDGINPAAQADQDGTVRGKQRRDLRCDAFGKVS